MFLNASAKDGARPSVLDGADVASRKAGPVGGAPLATTMAVGLGLLYLGANGFWILTIWLTATLLGWAFLFGAAEASDPSRRQPKQTSRTETRAIGRPSCRQPAAALGSRSEPNALVWPGGVNFVASALDRRSAQIGHGRMICWSLAPGEGDLGRPFDRRDAIEFFRFGYGLGDVDANTVDWASLERSLPGFSSSPPSAFVSARPMTSRQTSVVRGAPPLRWGKRPKALADSASVEHEGRSTAN